MPQITSMMLSATIFELTAIFNHCLLLIESFNIFEVIVDDVIASLLPSMAAVFVVVS